MRINTLFGLLIVRGNHCETGLLQPRGGVIEAPFLNFSIMKIYDFTKSHDIEKETRVFIFRKTGKITNLNNVHSNPNPCPGQGCLTQTYGLAQPPLVTVPQPWIPIPQAPVQTSWAHGLFYQYGDVIHIIYILGYITMTSLWALHHLKFGCLLRLTSKKIFKSMLLVLCEANPAHKGPVPLTKGQ